MSDTSKNFNGIVSEGAPTGNAQEENLNMNLNYRLMKDRVVILNGPVMPESVLPIIMQLKLLEADPNNGSKPIQLFINSPGGSVVDGLALFNVIRQLKCPVATIGMGMCASMGSFLVSAGTPGHRYLLPDAKVLIHRPSSGGKVGSEADVALTARDMALTRKRLEQYYIKFMGLPADDKAVVNTVKKAMQYDSWLNATIAQKMGLVDKILYPANPALAEENALTQKMDLEELNDIDGMDRDDPNYMALVAMKDIIALREKLQGKEDLIITKKAQAPANNP